MLLLVVIAVNQMQAAPADWLHRAWRSYSNSYEAVIVCMYCNTRAEVLHVDARQVGGAPPQRLANLCFISTRLVEQDVEVVVQKHELPASMTNDANRSLEMSNGFVKVAKSLHQLLSRKHMMPEDAAAWWACCCAETASPGHCTVALLGFGEHDILVSCIASLASHNTPSP